jgi:hypothetical protein
MSTRRKANVLDVERILTELEAAHNKDRVAFLCILAHSLTVDIRAALLDRPVSDVDAEKAFRVNEWLHQLTSCVNPTKPRRPAGDVELVRAIVESAELWGLQAAAQRGISTAAGNTIARKQNILGVV